MYGHMLKPGFHYPSWRPELTVRVDGWPLSITRQHGPSTRLVETRARQHGPCWRVMETGHPSTRAVNSGRQSQMRINAIITRLHCRSEWVNTTTFKLNFLSFYSASLTLLYDNSPCKTKLTLFIGQVVNTLRILWALGRDGRVYRAYTDMSHGVVLCIICYASTSIGRGHYEMRCGVCSSVCRVPRPNLTTERPIGSRKLARWKPITRVTRELI